MGMRIITTPDEHGWTAHYDNYASKDGDMPVGEGATVSEAVRDLTAKFPLAQCDCCGKMRPNVRSVVAYGMDTAVCEECLS